MESFKTLKLDSSFRPVEVIDAVEALILCIVGKALAVEEYAEEIRTVTKNFTLPSVIALKRVVKFRFTTMAPARDNVFWRDNNQCQYCCNVFPKEELTLDHIVPRSKGGDNSWLNLVAACKKCNQKKGNCTPEQANMILIRKPYRPKTNILRAVNKNEINPIWKEYLWGMS
ncbi:MAG TPA: HNH endonuclease [Balneola sp.]|nr:HNH endonuclease [Balneola sp.]|tara:strand:- start:146 stop:658 length:513 start_codon:yes stop_codon:yes gene_type:complete